MLPAEVQTASEFAAPTAPPPGVSGGFLKYNATPEAYSRTGGNGSLPVRRATLQHGGQEMAEERQTKVCKVCYEQIDARAKKCPFCRQYQEPFVFFTLHPALVMWLFVLPLVALYAFMGLWLYRSFSTGEDFARHEGELRVISSNMAWAEDESAPAIWVVGELENSGNVPWTDIQIEVQFTDRAGRLVDKDTKPDRGTVPPHRRAPFMVATIPGLPRDNYAACKVYVRWAKDARKSWFFGLGD
jgi:hypothetical protein